MGSVQSRNSNIKQKNAKRTCKKEQQVGLLFDLNELLIDNGLCPQISKLEAIRTAYEYNLIQLSTYAFLIQDRSEWMN